MWTVEGGWGRTSLVKPVGLNPGQARAMAVVFIAATAIEDQGFLLGFQLGFAWLPASVSCLNCMTTKLYNAAL